MRVNISLKTKFILLTLSSFFVIGPVIYFTAKNQITNFLLNTIKADFSSHIQSHADKYLDLSHPVSIKTQAKYQDFTQSLYEIPNISNVEILDPNGTVIYADNASQVGSDLSATSGVSQSVNNIVTINNIDPKRESGLVYAPIKSKAGDVRGILIASVELSELFNQANSFTTNFILITGGLSLFFVVVSYFIYSNASDSMQGQERSLLDKSKALEEERQIDEAIISSLAESLVVINKDGQIMVFNPEAERITGHIASDVEYRLYRKILQFVDKDGKEIKENPITQSLHSGKKTEAKIKDGYFIKNTKRELVPIALSAAPILTKENRIQGVAVTIQDVTTEKELDKVKDEFVYVVAHELGNPIFALDGYLSILETKEKRAPKEVKMVIDSAKSINNQLSSLVNDLLEVVRNQSGKLEIEVTPIDLALITKEVVASANFRAKSKKIKIHYLESKAPRTMGNEQKIKEVITNLVDNAIKYTPSGGMVEVWHEIDEGMVVTHIRDNGLGIDKASQEHLFQQFFRVKNEKTSGISGTGLGLFICKQIIEKCGGKIWAQSEEGKGSTFSFSLKRAK